MPPKRAWDSDMHKYNSKARRMNPFRRDEL
jgi:hypothetical protein